MTSLLFRRYAIKHAPVITKHYLSLSLSSCKLFVVSFISLLHLVKQPKPSEFQTLSQFLKSSTKEEKIMSTQKRALASTSSGQASLLKRQRVTRTNPVCQRSKTNHIPRSWLTKEDVRKVVREELERAKSHSAEYCQSCTGNALKDIVRSLENAVQKLEEAVEPANSYSPPLRRANAKSTTKSDTRNLRLQLRTKLSRPLFTGKNIEGEEGARVCVALIDANTGYVITSGPESSIKLEVVALEGDFNKDDQDNWAQEEFEKYVARERAGKGPLLRGDLLVTLKKGLGELGDVIFTDNSSWNRTKRFRIGLKVASGYCGNTRIQEAVTDAFRVKEHRGESSQKNYPPKCDDEVWRLEKIAKDGKCHQKLSKAEIYKVEDFLLQLFTDSNKLREILGKSIIQKNWDSLVRHAMTCKINWKPYLYYHDSMRKHGALFDADGQLIGLIKDRVYIATHRLSAQEKEHGDTIVKKALDNKNDVMEFDGDTISPSMQKKSSSSLTQQICDAPGVLEAPQANVGFTTEVLSPGHNETTALALPVQSQDTSPTNDVEFSVDDFLAEDLPIFRNGLNVVISPGDNGVTAVGLPMQYHDINLQYAMHSQMMYSWSSMDHIVNEQVLPPRPTYTPTSSFRSSRCLLSSSTLPLPEGNHGMEDFRSLDLDDSAANGLAGIQNPPDDDMCFQTSEYHATRNACACWMKIFGVLKWFSLIRKKRLRVVG